MSTTSQTTPAPAQAGRELDAEVGKAFGFEPRVSWHVLSPDGKGSAYGADSEYEVTEWLKDTLRKYPDSWIKDYHVGAWESWPRFSTEMSAAWKVVEKVKGEWHYEIRIEHSGCESELWDCLIFSDGIDGLIGLVSREAGETAALAICRAALKAAEVRSAALSVSEADRATQEQL